MYQLTHEHMLKKHLTLWPSIPEKKLMLRFSMKSNELLTISYETDSHSDRLEHQKKLQKYI